LELVVEAQELLVFDVEQLLMVRHHHSEIFTPCPHFDLTVLDQSTAALCQALVEVLARYDHACAACQCLDLQRPVLDLGEHLLHRLHLVDDVQMVPAVNVLV